MDRLEERNNLFICMCGESRKVCLHSSKESGSSRQENLARPTYT